jgi:hypothetical protein
MYGRMGGMEKTTVYLTSQQKAALARAAHADGRSEARLIRDGIDAELARRAIGEAVAPNGGAVVATREVDGETGHPPRWMRRDEFLRRFAAWPADAALRGELRDLAPETTDELPDR